MSISKMFKVTILVFLISLMFFCSTNNGVQGEWIEGSYTMKERNVTKTERMKVKVERSAYLDKAETLDVNEIVIIVEWRCINNNKITSDYSWENKFLVDGDGNIFKPFKGQGQSNLHPTMQSEVLSDFYRIPKTVGYSNLYWGLYHDIDNGGFRYKIKLKPFSFVAYIKGEVKE